MISLDRLLQREGFGSRRDCRRLVHSGRVVVDGIACADPDALFNSEGVPLCVDGVDWVCRERAVLMLNKPAGCECSRSPTHHPSVLALLPPQLVRRGVQPVGRLDAETTGLLILTDDGALNHRLCSPRHGVDKTYRAVLKHAVDAAWAERLCQGMVLRDSPEPVAAKRARMLTPQLVELTIGEGRYHQVRRMVAAAGNRIEALTRIAIGALSLPDDLAPGTWRWLDESDLSRLTSEEPASSPPTTAG